MADCYLVVDVVRLDSYIQRTVLLTLRFLRALKKNIYIQCVAIVHLKLYPLLRSWYMEYTVTCDFSTFWRVALGCGPADVHMLVSLRSHAWMHYSYAHDCVPTYWGRGTAFETPLLV